MTGRCVTFVTYASFILLTNTNQCVSGINNDRLLERVLGKNVWVLNVNKTAAWFGRGRVVTPGKSDQGITDLSVVAKFYSVKVSSMGKTLKCFGGKKMNSLKFILRVRKRKEYIQMICPTF